MVYAHVILIPSKGTQGSAGRGCGRELFRVLQHRGVRLRCGCSCETFAFAGCSGGVCRAAYPMELLAAVFGALLYIKVRPARALCGNGASAGSVIYAARSFIGIF